MSYIDPYTLIFSGVENKRNDAGVRNGKWMAFPELNFRFDLSQGPFVTALVSFFFRLSSWEDQIKFVECLLLSGQNIFSSRLLPNSVQIKVQRAIFLPIVFTGVNWVS